MSAMIKYHFALFGTAIGHCGIAWSERGIARVNLPEESNRATVAVLLEYCGRAQPAQPQAHVAAVIEDITALLQGSHRSLQRAKLDMIGIAPFYCRVYEAARKIPTGCTVTYGDIAKQLGAIGSARAVGQALGKNPFAVIVPCHRVLAKDGRLCGFSANGGVATKLRLLQIEGALDPAALGNSSPGRREKAVQYRLFATQ
jgi:methylated-DNA-[protein]-cysteine S-methyltransferase